MVEVKKSSLGTLKKNVLAILGSSMNGTGAIDDMGSEPAAIVSVAVHSPPQTQSADAQSLTLSESVNV